MCYQLPLSFLRYFDLFAGVNVSSIERHGLKRVAFTLRRDSFPDAVRSRDLKVLGSERSRIPSMSRYGPLQTGIGHGLIRTEDLAL